jgi:inosine-uridine nucleoside N-ribohydrolase
MVGTSGAQSSLPILIDTDPGTDDLLAIAYLLALPDIRIDAITVVHGFAHLRSGAHNIPRLLLVAGKPDIPVYEGDERPLKGNRTSGCARFDVSLGTSTDNRLRGH